MALVPMMATFNMRNGLEVCRIINGLWQVSGAHGKIDPMKAQLDMNIYSQKGLTSFDMADIYGPAEEIFGNFIKSLGPQNTGVIQGLTKMVQCPAEINLTTIQDHVLKSMSRMCVKKLDCIQLHWWDYSDKRFLDVLKHLSQLQSQGLIRELSLTNFDTERLIEIHEIGIRISSNQVQYSLIDMRPVRKMKDFCIKNDIKLLVYGTLCGGLLTDNYLDKPEPRGPMLSTASLVKYKKMVDEWGGWNLFQELLKVLRKIANKYSVSIANIATRCVLDDPVVGGVIIGCKMGRRNHIDDNYRSVSTSWCLEDEDWEDINEILIKSQDLLSKIGDCGSEYRNRSSSSF